MALGELSETTIHGVAVSTPFAHAWAILGRHLLATVHKEVHRRENEWHAPMSQHSSSWITDFVQA